MAHLSSSSAKQRLNTFQLQPDEVIWLEQVYLPQSVPFGPVNILLVWDERHQRPLLLVTNFQLWEEARYWYRKCPWIEPLFGDGLVPSPACAERQGPSARR